MPFLFVDCSCELFTDAPYFFSFVSVYGRDGEFEMCSSLVCFGTGRVASVIWEVKLPNISANVCLSSTTGPDL